MKEDVRNAAKIAFIEVTDDELSCCEKFIEEMMIITKELFEGEMIKKYEFCEGCLRKDIVEEDKILKDFIKNNVETFEGYIVGPKII